MLSYYQTQLWSRFINTLWIEFLLVFAVVVVCLFGFFVLFFCLFCFSIKIIHNLCTHEQAFSCVSIVCSHCERIVHSVTFCCYLLENLDFFFFFFVFLFTVFASCDHIVTWLCCQVWNVNFGSHAHSCLLLLFFCCFFLFVCFCFFFLLYLMYPQGGFLK